MKTPLRELSESISGRIGGLDDELKMKVGEVNNLRGILQVCIRALARWLAARRTLPRPCASLPC